MALTELIHPLALLAVIVTGVVRGLAGFGVGLLLAPALSLVYGAVTAVVTVVLIDVPALLYILRLNWRYADWRTVAWIVSGGIAGTPFGTFLLVSLDAVMLRRVIGFFALIFTLILARDFRFRTRPGIPTVVGVGVACGSLGATTALIGPPAVLYFLSGPYSAREARANIIAFLGCLDLVLIAAFLWNDLVTTEILMRTGALMPVYFAATWVGNRLFGMVDERFFRRAALLLIAATALVALLS